MSISISSALATPVAAATTSTAAQARAPQPTTTASADTVQLSEVQQVHQLYNQGQPISQIAANLNLTVDAVNLYLGNSG